MPLKPILFLVAVCFVLSCGSTKKVANSKSETASKTETSSSTTKKQIKTEDEVIVDVDENTETKDKTKTETKVLELEKEEVPEDTFEDTEPEMVEMDVPQPKELTLKMNHHIWNQLLQNHVSSNGNVNYKGFTSNRVKFYRYIEQLQNHVPKDTWSKNEKLAYWINAYNAFTVDLILRNYPLQSIKDIKDPWEQRLWKIGEKWYNLNDIEHQILRKMNEPRIHFAIVCASVSCPKLQNTAFTASELEMQLTEVTKAFLSDKSKNNISENHIELSKIFKWFSKDFKTKNSNLIDFLNQYSDIRISKSTKKNFLDYNWNLNE
ncbi:DUF547 domain-containing protein [Psychroserpens sp. S379A]|uniref:DUF547 domain-containing protein n=1 Tax=Psychroserpens sp. S379A TaxID=3415137 RepID=UPI003C7B6A74